MLKPENPNSSKYSSVDDAVDEEKIKSIVVPLGQVLRKDLPLEARRTIINKFNNTIQQYSNFASLFDLHVQLNILKFVISGDIAAESTRVQVDSIIPREFRASSASIEFPAPPTNQANDDVKRKSDYKTLFTLNHLQVISTLLFGASGIQKGT
ncbi:hypothetical protein HPULCUR_003226 [Helicostylum pulchrum]|uniref:Uncharacterized protein n=1 Tax=Helicostylum pulchrum TaxID=562976 RepID=A0ABP9XU17_9FUNG